MTNICRKRHPNSNVALHRLKNECLVPCILSYSCPTTKSCSAWLRVFICYNCPQNYFQPTSYTQACK